MTYAEPLSYRGRPNMRWEIDRLTTEGTHSNVRYELVTFGIFALPGTHQGHLPQTRGVRMKVIIHFTEDSFRELTRLATSEVAFSFNGEMHRQIDCVAMGSPFGPTLANIFIGFYEKKIPENERPRMYH